MVIEESGMQFKIDYFSFRRKFQNMYQTEDSYYAGIAAEYYVEDAADRLYSFGSAL